MLPGELKAALSILLKYANQFIFDFQMKNKLLSSNLDNKQKEFSGIDETTLRRIGYNSIEEKGCQYLSKIECKNI